MPGVSALVRMPRVRVVGLMVPAVMLAVALTLPSAAWATRPRVAPRVTAPANVSARGELDCNGDSPAQRAQRPTMSCTDIRGIAGIDNQNTWDGRFYDNGNYIGHDEPDMTFLSSRSGSGNDVTWTERIPADPSSAPTVARPGSDVAHWFELSVAPWFSMAMCDPNSYPQTPCAPLSDANAPAADGTGGGGSAFMEMQLYPPGFAPFDDAISCDNRHWCAALNIDSLACTEGVAVCNSACEEPVNFAYIQTNGVPPGPVAPSEADVQTFSPNSHTLLMNPGDVITVHMFDAPVPGGGGGHAFEVVIRDLTTRRTGFMQASAANGFQNTSITNCSGTPFNFQPEYNTAAQANIVPWAALQTNISTEFEIGHFTPCTGVSGAGSYPVSNTISDTFYNSCAGPYEAGGDSTTWPEPTDAFCYPAGDTHGALNTAPDTVTGCTDTLAGGDLDFDGTPYWAEWPLGPFATRTYPGSFVQALPSTQDRRQYDSFFIQTDTALSESTCTATTAGCAIPAPGSPGGFYPYWSRATTPFGCFLEFGNVSWGVNGYGGDSQYGTDQSPTLGYPEFEGPVMSNRCGRGWGAGHSGAGTGGLFRSVSTG
jgi:hypothetical protein